MTPGGRGPMPATDAARPKVCTRKVAHPNKAQAQKVARRQQHKGKGRLHPYLCVFCGLWHNGRFYR